MEATTSLFKQMQLFRLTYDMKVTEERIRANTAVPVANTASFLSRLGTNISNGVKNANIKKYLEQKEKIQERLQDFSQKNAGEAIDGSTSGIATTCRELYQDRGDDMPKTVFSLMVILDAEYNYVYNDDGIRELSKILWRGDPEAMQNIKNDYKKYYTAMARQPLSTEQKIALGGAAAFLALTPFVAPVAFAGAAAPVITGGLAGIGGTMVGGIGVMAVAEMLLDGLAVWATYTAMDTYNKSKVKQSFREMSLDDAARMLAMKIYLLDVTKRTQPAETYKESVNEVLQMLQDLKSDTDYMLFVELENIDTNKHKINLFHNFDKIMLSVAGV